MDGRRLTLVLAVAALTVAVPGAAGPGGPCGYFGPSRNDFRLRLGSHRRHWNNVWWGNPGFAFGSPYYFQPYYQPFYTSPYSLWNVGLPYGYLGYPRYVETYRPAPTVPSVVDASRIIVNQAPPPVYPSERPDSPEGERFYLDRAPAPRPASLVDLAREQIRVELAEPGMYFVRWTGPTEDLSLVEFQTVDAAGRVRTSRLLKEPPFRGLLRIPEKAASVLITLEQRSGAGASVKLPVAEFKSLEVR